MTKIYEYIDSPSHMDPLFPESESRDIEDLVGDLFKKSSNLIGKLHPDISEQVGTLVRSMNCYYSNLEYLTLMVSYRSLDSRHSGPIRAKDISRVARPIWALTNTYVTIT